MRNEKHGKMFTEKMVYDKSVWLPADFLHVLAVSLYINYSSVCSQGNSFWNDHTYKFKQLWLQ